jgi:hypothetical protein
MEKVVNEGHIARRVEKGEAAEVDDYLDARGLLRNALFHHLLQSLIELAPRNSEKRSLLESPSNHIMARGVSQKQQPYFSRVPEGELP